MRIDDLRGEVIAANPADVAHADQIAAAEPRREPSEVVLRDWIPSGTVYVLNLDAMQQMFDDELAKMRFTP